MARTKRIDHQPIVKHFAARLRVMRRERGMSQQALAFKALVTPSYIGKLERGGASPGLDMVGRLAEALAVKPERLIAGKAPASSGLPVAKEQIQRHVRRLLTRHDEQGLQAVAVVLALIDNALARQ